MELIELEAYRAPYFAMKEYVENKINSIGYNHLIDTGNEWIGCDWINCHCFPLGRTMSECVRTIDNVAEPWMTY